MANVSRPANNTEAKGVPIATEIALYSVLLFWSLLGNALVVAVVLSYGRLKTNFNYLVVNMAVSDLLVPLANLPHEIYSAAQPHSPWLIDGDFGKAFCKLCNLFLNISPYVSSLSLVIIAFERLVLVVYPMLKNALFSSKKIWFLIAFTWIVAVAFHSPNFFWYDLKTVNGTLYCESTATSEASKPFHILTILTLFFVPLAAIIVIYTIMLYNLMKASRNVARIINYEQMIARQRRNKKILYMSISIIVAFVIFWGPFFSFTLMHQVSMDIPVFKELSYPEFKVAMFVFKYLAYANAAVNPCLYFMFLGSYREGARRMFIKKSQSSGEEALEMSRVRSTTLSARKDNRILVECDSLMK